MGIILAQLNSPGFTYWFYRCFQYPPYSWDCRTIDGVAFPMPYSLFWYSIYVPLTAGGYWTFNLTMLTVDIITGILIARKWSQLMLGLWAQGSIYFLIVSPQDFLIWTLMLAGRIRRVGPLFLGLAILTKFPLLPPIFDSRVWGFILSSPVSVHDQLNWARYMMLIFYWLLFLGIWVIQRQPTLLPGIPFLRQRGDDMNMWIAPIATLHTPGANENIRSTARDRDRSRPRQHSRHLHLYSLNRIGCLHRRPGARHHRAPDLRRHHPLRSLQTYRRWKKSPRTRPDEAAADPQTLKRLRTAARIRNIRLLALSSLFLLLLIAVPPSGHAVSQYAGFNASNVTGSGCTNYCEPEPTSNNAASGTSFQNPFASTASLVSVSIFTGTILPNRVVVTTFSGTPSLDHNTGSCNAYSANICPWYTVHTGQGYTVRDVESLSGLSASTFTTIILATPVSVSASQWVGVVYYAASNPGTQTFTISCNSGCDVATVAGLQIDFATTNPTVGSSYNSVACGGDGCANGTPTVGATFQTSGTPSPSTSQCYGNCGTPAVTLTNTNSTHTVNFNQSITLFYQFQSNLNGRVDNITTSIARSYSSGMSLQIGLYSTDPSCTTTSNPFTAACPGFLVGSSSLVTNPSKQRLTQSLNVPAANGQWFGVSVSGTFQGLDLNDTNTAVTLYQAFGFNPSVIDTFSSRGSSNLGLWAYVTGNVIISGPRVGPGSGCQTVTCGLQAFWLALGGDVAAGIVVLIALFGLFAGFLFHLTRGHGSVFPIVAPLLLVFTVLIMIMLAAAGVLPVYIPVLSIMIIAWLFTTVIWRHHGQGSSQPA